LRGILALLAGVACWGLTPVIIRRLTPFMDAWTANGIRYPIAAIVYWPLLYIAFRSGRLNLQLLRRCLVPALFSLFAQIFWGLAFYELQASEVSFLVRLSMLWAIVGSMVLFQDERLLLRRPGFYLGVILIVGGFLGMSLINQPTAADASVTVAADTESSIEQTDVPLTIETGNYTLGVIYVLLCGALFGFYMVSVRSCIPEVDPILAFGVVANFVSIGTITGMFWKGDVELLTQQTPFSWSLLIGSSLLGIALGHIMMYIAVQRLGAAITSSCQTLMPFVTAAAASFALSESLSRPQWIAGSVMILGAIVLLSLKHEISSTRRDHD